MSCPSKTWPARCHSAFYTRVFGKSMLLWTLSDWRRVGSEGVETAVFRWRRGGGCFNSKLNAVYVSIISLCCTYRMLDLLLSIDTVHISGPGAEGFDLCGSVWMKEILLTPRVRKNKCDIVFVCVCFSLPSLCPVVGDEEIREEVILQY